MPWPTKKLGEVEKIVRPILEKYERLLLTTSPVYARLKNDLQDQSFVSGVKSVLDNVENAQSIFSISSEITTQKNDQKVLEMFSEIDAAKWLIKGAIDGKYERIAYLKKRADGKSPDFVAYREKKIFTVEVKMLSPQDIVEDKFISKVIARVNDEAIPQLAAFGQQNRITRGIILFWTHQSIRLERISYIDLDKSITQRVTKPNFPLGIFVTVYGHGVWDFYL